MRILKLREVSTKSLNKNLRILGHQLVGEQGKIYQVNLLRVIFRFFKSYFFSSAFKGRLSATGIVNEEDVISERSEPLSAALSSEK